MYIEPFWCGVLATIIVEILAFITYAIYVAIKSMKKQTTGGIKMNMEEITLDDCLDNFEKKNKATIINDGMVVGSEEV